LKKWKLELFVCLLKRVQRKALKNLFYSATRKALHRYQYKIQVLGITLCKETLLLLTKM
jgi:hypothetical protein